MILCFKKLLKANLSWANSSLGKQWVNQNSLQDSTIAKYTNCKLLGPQLCPFHFPTMNDPP